MAPLLLLLAEAHAGCVTDSDCKGDRLCVRAVCTEPTGAATPPVTPPPTGAPASTPAAASASPPTPPLVRVAGATYGDAAGRPVTWAEVTALAEQSAAGVVAVRRCRTDWIGLGVVSTAAAFTVPLGIGLGAEGAWEIGSYREGDPYASAGSGALGAVAGYGLAAVSAGAVTVLVARWVRVHPRHRAQVLTYANEALE